MFWVTNMNDASLQVITWNPETQDFESHDGFEFSAVGAAVPLVLKALGQDPAVGSGVVVTTLVDLFGFFSFLGIGTLMIDRLL